MRSIAVLYVCVSSRFYELWSVLLSSAGVNLLTGSVDKREVQEPISGLLMVCAGILFWIVAWRVERYRENAIAQRKILEEQIMRFVNKGQKAPSVPSVIQLSISEALNANTSCIVAECTVVLSAILFTILSFFILIIA
jgi:hypothetical protein